MKIEDIRWLQRLENYSHAYMRLDAAVQLAEKRALTDLEKQGLIQAFEFTYELACNLMRGYLNYQGITDITGSRDAIRKSFKNGLLQHAEVWMDMIISRNKSSHTYNEAIAEEILKKVIDTYHFCFEEFLQRMNSLRDE